MITRAEIEETEQSSGNSSSINSFNTVVTQAHIHLSNLFIYLSRLDFRFKFITNLKLVCLFTCIDCGRVDYFFLCLYLIRTFGTLDEMDIRQIYSDLVAALTWNENIFQLRQKDQAKIMNI